MLGLILTTVLKDKMNQYIILDGEMGGIGNEYSLLTIYFQVTDDKFNPIDELDLFLKPDDGIYHVCGEAMSINQIDISIHDSKAITYKEGGTTLYKFLSKNSNGGNIKLVPVGHGMNGDLDQIFDKLISRKTWETFVSYRRLDTSVALQFLKACGLFPETVSGSLQSLTEYFNIIVDNFHNAKDDAIATKEVLKSMIDSINRMVT